MAPRAWSASSCHGRGTGRHSSPHDRRSSFTLSMAELTFASNWELVSARTVLGLLSDRSFPVLVLPCITVARSLLQRTGDASEPSRAWPPALPRAAVGDRWAGYATDCAAIFRTFGGTESRAVNV